MRTYVFLDLDNTLFQTAPRCPPGEPVEPVATGRDGQPLSFMTTRQRAFFRWLGRDATVIPVTGRSSSAYHRVELPFESHAVLDFGAVILEPGGCLDPEWDARVRPGCSRLGPRLEEICKQVEDFSRIHDLGVAVRVLHDHDMPIYLVAKHPRADLQALAAVRDGVLRPLLEGPDGADFYLHDNDNNLSLVPAFLGKERAVAYLVAERLESGERLLIGAGDSATDLPYMHLCDFWLVPRGSQLDELSRALLPDGDVQR